VRVPSKGQVTFPQAVREQLGLLPGAEVEFVVDGQDARIVKVPIAPGESRGQRLVARLRGRVPGR